MKDLLSVKEIADIVGVTEQSVYKRISKVDNPIQPFVVKEGNQLRIRKSAIELVYRKKVDNTTTQPSLEGVKKVEKETENETEQQTEKGNAIPSASYEKIIDILRQQLEANQKEMEEKNNIIRALNERLAEQSQMLNQQQKLSALDKQQILELDEGNTEGKKKRKGFFGFFGRQ